MTTHRLGRGSTRRGVAAGLTLAMVAAALSVGVLLFVLRTGMGQQVDLMALDGFDRLLRGSGPGPMLDSARGVVLIGLLVVSAIAVIVRRQWPAAVQVVVLFGGVTATAEGLDRLAPVLFRAHAVPVYPFAEAVDRTTALLACGGAALVLVARPRHRPIAAILAAVFVGPMAASPLLSYGSRPSTLVVAVLITAMWTGLVVAGLAVARGAGYAPEPPAPRAGRTALLTGTLALAVAGLAAAVAAAVFTAEWYRGPALLGGGARAAEAVALLGAAGAVGAAVSFSLAAALITISEADRRTGPVPGSD